MIEAMACETATIAYRRGRFRIMIDNVTGFVVDDLQAAVDVVRRIPEIDRRTCRAVFDQKFTSRRMTLDYLA